MKKVKKTLKLYIYKELLETYVKSVSHDSTRFRGKRLTKIGVLGGL